MNGEYENLRRICFDCKDGGIAIFIPVCPVCGRFVRSDATIRYNESVGIKDEPNATCKKDGRVSMIFEGFFSNEELE